MNTTSIVLVAFLAAIVLVLAGLYGFYKYQTRKARPPQTPQKHPLDPSKTTAVKTATNDRVRDDVLITEMIRTNNNIFNLALDTMLDNHRRLGSSLRSFAMTVLERVEAEMVFYNSLVSRKDMLHEFVPGYHLLIVQRAFRTIRAYSKGIGMHEIAMELVGFLVKQFDLRVLWSGFNRNHSRVAYSTRANAISELLMDFFLDKDLEKYYDYQGSLDFYDPTRSDLAVQFPRAEFYKHFKKVVLDDAYHPKMRELTREEEARETRLPSKQQTNQNQRAKRMRHKNRRSRFAR